MANDAAVGKTFFFLPLMLEKWPLVVQAFWNNVFIFVIAEILVLVWGLVVAIARLLPGPAGQPIRMLAIIYCDVFRGLPAVRHALSRRLRPADLRPSRSHRSSRSSGSSSISRR